MKRGGPIQRRAPLRRSSSERKTGLPLTRTKRLTYRPKPRTADEVAARAAVATRSEGMCELGITCSGGAYATDVCHRLARSQGGPWDPANLLAGCRSCHGHTHSWPEEARAHGWMVRRGHDFRSIPVLHAVHGWIYLTSDGGYTPTTERPNAA